MPNLIIYDNNGRIFLQVAGNYTKPQGGIQFLEVEIPKGKQIKITDGIGVDVSVTPHEVILENIPPTEIEELRSVVADLTEVVLMGGV